MNEGCSYSGIVNTPDIQKDEVQTTPVSCPGIKGCLLRSGLVGMQATEEAHLGAACMRQKIQTSQNQ